jgi:aspartate racemase
MRVIGLIGGMSWVSTGHYYQLVNADVARRLGGDHCARLVVWQTDFDEITRLQMAGNWDQAGQVLAGGARCLVAAGAELIGIGANTMHLVADQVAQAAEPARLVHIVDAVRDACTALGVRRLGLLGTSYTMESPALYPLTMAAASIEVLVPGAPDRAAIQRHTFDELIHDRVTDEARATFERASRDLIERGADAIVLACTEHGMVLHDGALSVPVLDSTVVHARALVDAALA